MNVSVEKLRRWFLLGALLLAVTVASFIGYAHYRARRFLANLPGHLGADIRSETNGFTYSQSIKGNTLFTLHAAKLVQLQNGKATLHDVSIIVYDRSSGPGKAERTDRISGAEFEYDQPNGIVRAAGEVQIDLQATTGGQNDDRVHLRTSGLVFAQKLGVAATEKPVEFSARGIHGSAVGAEFDSDTGVLLLRHDVRAEQDADGRRATLTAASGEMNRSEHVARLRDATYSADGRTVGAARLTADLQNDGSMRSVHGEGVKITAAGDEEISASRATVSLDAKHRASTAEMTGGVRFAQGPLAGTSRSAQLHFNPQGKPSEGLFSGDVDVQDSSTSNAKHLTAQQVQVSLGQAREHILTATGAARWTMSSGPKEVTQLSADTLRATLLGEGQSTYLRSVHGEGQCILNQSLPSGIARHSTADTLDVTLRPQTGKRSSAALERAIESGNVVLTERRPATNASRTATETVIHAARADFDGATQRAVLTGSPRIESAGMQISATTITLDQKSGDALAVGSIKGTLSQPGGAVHMIASRMEARIDGAAVLYGGLGLDARIWQSGSQITAPRIDLDRTKQTLHATSSAAARVQAVLPTNEGAKDKTSPGAVRITANDLLYTGTGALPSATFTGNVNVQQIAGRLSADQLVVAFNSASKQETQAIPTGQVQSMRMTGDIRLSQQGRTGTGDKLTYEAATGQFALTGTPSAPPRIEDAERGTITGDSLLFHSGSDSVIVEAAPGKRVHAETRIRR